MACMSERARAGKKGGGPVKEMGCERSEQRENGKGCCSVGKVDSSEPLKSLIENERAGTAR